ncbi:MAG: hypothetical protein QOD78_1755 [Chloroflexota bacterium]|nr:hypothetical protein [Chloroflexota bacterium]
MPALDPSPTDPELEGYVAVVARSQEAPTADVTVAS